MNFRANMASLRSLSDDHYQGRISFEEYREQRSQLLALIDEDLNGIKKAVDQTEKNEVKVSESLVNKALSFLRID